MVAGTSMGALIGGAFAAGMPPADIRAFVEAADWSMMLSIDSPFTVKSFRRKQDARAFPTDVKLGLKHGFSLPGGLSAGPQIDLMLDQIALPYFDLRSFDDLPTRLSLPICVDQKSSSSIRDCCPARCGRRWRCRACSRQ
jgi:NTE family protein